MRILGAAPVRVPKRDQPVPPSLRQSARNLRLPSPVSTINPNPHPLTYFNTWRTRNLDDDDERFALADWLPKPSVSSSSPHSPTPPVSSSGPTDTEPWVTAFAVVHFHHDHGQTLDYCLPLGVLTQAELDTVCYHALPDSASINSVSQDAIFSFRIPRRLHPSEEKSIAVASTRLLLAHTLFRQSPDASQPRGFFQKALVIVTSTPYLGLPAVMLSILAPKVFVHGKPVLEQAIRDLTHWPDPRQHPISESLTLPFVGDTISLSIPHSFLLSFSAPVAATLTLSNQPDHKRFSPTAITSYTTHQNGTDPWDVSSSAKPGAVKPDSTQSWPLCSPSENWSVPLFHEINPVVALAGVLDYLPALWELLVTGEPILIRAHTPTACSAAVMALMGLIHPLPFIGDWRPYFSIYDADYDRIVHSRDVRDLFVEGAVYGVTNQFLVETLDFPHVLYLPYIRSDGKSVRGRLVSPLRPCLQRSRTVKLAAARALAAHAQRDMHEATDRVNEFRSCVYDKYVRPFLLTFDRYLVPSMLGHRNSSHPVYQKDPFGRLPLLPSLDLQNFPLPEDLASVQKIASFKKGSAWRNRSRSLYISFVQGPVFREWWHDVRSTAERECTAKHRSCVLDACANLNANLTSSGDTDDAGRNIGLDELLDLQSRIQLELSRLEKDDDTLRDALRALVKNLNRPVSRSTKTRPIKPVKDEQLV